MKGPSRYQAMWLQPFFKCWYWNIMYIYLTGFAFKILFTFSKFSNIYPYLSENRVHIERHGAFLSGNRILLISQEKMGNLA